ncbi:hypothetical protein [Streptomyces sp. NBC_01244]|uniref:hypothetical protein n=1 Tax=Streptomyces sp. NBC_01244 TaxID=2903797 RepID=UPI003FA3B448
MVRHARSRLGSGIEERQHDLDDPLDWIPDEAVDLVLATLVIHYVRDRGHRSARAPPDPASRGAPRVVHQPPDCRLARRRRQLLRRPPCRRDLDRRDAAPLLAPAPGTMGRRDH